MILYIHEQKKRQTLPRIFEKPERSDISWNDIEGLFNALGAELSEDDVSQWQQLFLKPRRKK